MNKFDSLRFIKKFTRYPERQLEHEISAAADIIAELAGRRVPYRLQPFTLSVPRAVQAELTAGGRKVACGNSGFFGGRIRGKDNLISSLSSGEFSAPNINFNPGAAAISRATHYFAPSLAIAARDVKKIIAAEKVVGLTRVRKVRHRSRNIIVGNVRDPKVIFFSHYDSIEKGAVDNAGGTAVMLEAVFSDRRLLENNLFVFSGAEELSYDRPVYWGRGYRVFEKKYFTAMKRAAEIVVADCVGHARPEITKDPTWIFQAFPVRNLPVLRKKIRVVSGCPASIFGFYHSAADRAGNIRKKYLRASLKIVITAAKKRR